MKYVFEAHDPVKRFKRLSWLVCKYCGLVYLNNRFTKWSIKKGCNSSDHPDYERMRCGG
jgi:hypothetical protein